MANLNLSEFVRRAQTTVVENSPKILLGIGITGMISTTVLAVKATPKALRRIDEVKNSRDDGQLSKMDVVKTTWKYYIPATVTGVVSVACLIGADSVHAKRNAALATIYKLSESAFSDYREKVIETIGEKKEKVVREHVAEEYIKRNPVNESSIIITGKGNSRCFDPLSGRRFESDIDRIKRAEIKLNKEMQQGICGSVSLNDFYDELGLEHTDIGDVLGWNTFNLIDLDITAHVDEDGTPSLVIGHLNRPEYDY